MPRISRVPLFGTILFVFACENPQPVAPSLDPSPRFAQAPSDGNGNKRVFQFDFTFPVSCGAATIDRNVRGWFQVQLFGQPNNRNVELDVFHGTNTYTNSAGETFVWHDVGRDHYYLDSDGNLIITITGPSTASGNLARDHIVIGHVVINLTTGEVKMVAGRELESVNELACAALT